MRETAIRGLLIYINLKRPDFRCGDLHPHALGRVL